MKHRFVIPVAITLLMGGTGSEAPAPQSESQNTPKASSNAEEKDEDDKIIINFEESNRKIKE